MRFWHKRIMMSGNKQIVPTAFQKDTPQESYPPLSKIYGQLVKNPTEHRFKHLYCGTKDPDEYHTLFEKHIQLKKDYLALEQELYMYKKVYIDEMIKTSSTSKL